MEPPAKLYRNIWNDNILHFCTVDCSSPHTQLMHSAPSSSNSFCFTKSVWCEISLSSGYPEDSFYVDVKVSEYSDGDKKNVLESNNRAPFLKKDPPINIFKLTIDQMTVCNVRSCSDKATESYHLWLLRAFFTACLLFGSDKARSCY